MTSKEASAVALEAMTPMKLAEYLSEHSQLILTSENKLVLRDMDPSDFLTAATAADHLGRLQVLQKIMGRFSLEISLEGSVAIGEFHLDTYSWTLLPGTTGNLTIRAKPMPLKRTLAEIVSFLNMLPVGQAMVLKPHQDLLLSGFSSDAMLDYYQFCQDNSDAKVRELQQDKLFCKSSQLLESKGLTCKIYGLNAVQIDRMIDIHAGGIVFRPIGDEVHSKPSVLMALTAHKA